MRENRLSGLTSGAWKRGMESLLRHRQTKGPETDKTLLNYRATPRLYTLGIGGVSLPPPRVDTLGGLCGYAGGRPHPRLALR